MTPVLTIHLERSEGALVRLLGLAERRGYCPVRVSAVPAGPDRTVVHLGVHSDRPLDQLIRQINKLYDVLHVEKTP